jgi:hypothetical protein
VYVLLCIAKEDYNGVMTIPDSDIQTIFLEELNIFKNEVYIVIKSLYTELAIGAIATNDSKVMSALNTSPTFWNAVLGSLQQSTFITLGRIFEVDASKHTLNTLMNIASTNIDLFSKEAFSQRWKIDRTSLHDYLPEYLEKSYFPSVEEFRQFSKYVSKQKAFYKKTYAPIRIHFAHKMYVSNSDVQVLFDKVNIPELESFCVRLYGIYDVLWNLYHNARGPLLPLKSHVFSTEDILKQEIDPFRPGNLNKQLLHEVKDALLLLKMGHHMKLGDII